MDSVQCKRPRQSAACCHHHQQLRRALEGSIPAGEKLEPTEVVQKVMASPRFAEIPMPGGVYYDKEKGEYCSRFSDEKAVGSSLSTLLTTSPHTFFERYLLIITAKNDLLGYFANLALNDNHEVLAFIQGASRATKCYGDDGNPVTAPGNSKVVGHRRVLWMKREEDKIDGYFSEARMRRRDAGLWHSLVGKFDTEKGGAKLIDAVDDAEYSAADEEGKREMRKSYIV
ncbi:hypothetical protein FOZ63_008943, partial [Perkinsus olseni]